MVGCRQRGAVITVVDPDAARRSLVAGELACPQPDCGGRLRVWSRALPRRVRGLDGTVVRVTPDRPGPGPVPGLQGVPRPTAGRVAAPARVRRRDRRGGAAGRR